MALGLKKDDKVANISNNQPQWNFVDIGILQIGAYMCPSILPFSEDDYKFILNDASVKVVFVSDKALLEKIQNIRSSVPSIMEIYIYDEVEGAKEFGSELKELGKTAEDPGRLEGINRKNVGDDIATLIYTSGTTGVPKGVMLSHTNIASNVWACPNLTPCDQRHTRIEFSSSLSYLRKNAYLPEYV